MSKNIENIEENGIQNGKVEHLHYIKINDEIILKDKYEGGLNDAKLSRKHTSKSMSLAMKKFAMYNLEVDVIEDKISKDEEYYECIYVFVYKLMRRMGWGNRILINEDEKKYAIDLNEIRKVHEVSDRAWRVGIRPALNKYNIVKEVNGYITLNPAIAINSSYYEPRFLEVWKNEMAKYNVKTMKQVVEDRYYEKIIKEMNSKK